MKRKLLLDEPPDSHNVKTLYEVFSWGREAHGEYLYFAEIDANAVKKDGAGDLTAAHYFASVEVSFEPDTLAVASHQIERAKRARYYTDLDEFENLTPALLIDEFGGEDGDAIMSSAESSCVLLTVVSFSNSVLIKDISVHQDRTAEIVVKGAGCGITLGEMQQRFDSLQAIYRDIPMRRFTGAVRE